jgi:hypothetical protein
MCVCLVRNTITSANIITAHTNTATTTTTNTDTNTITTNTVNTNATKQVTGIPSDIQRLQRNRGTWFEAADDGMLVIPLLIVLLNFLWCSELSLKPYQFSINTFSGVL